MQEAPSMGYGFIWILIIGVGAVAGWITGRMMKDRGFGAVVNMIIGAVGAILGSVLTALFWSMDVRIFIVGIIGAIAFLFLVSWIKNRTRTTAPVGIGPLPTITTIQASDAPQHTAKLREILQNLKSENRIGQFNTMNADEDLSSQDNMEEQDLILVVLTNQLDSQKAQIESRLSSIKARVAEIIVDHVTYDNQFLTFPMDLRPIRDRENMDAVWSSIEQSLKDMFPAKKASETESAL